MSGRMLLKYFTEAELKPAAVGSMPASPAAGSLLTGAELDDLRKMVDSLTSHGEVSFIPNELSRQPHLRSFLAFLRALGAVRVDASAEPEKARFETTGRLARHVPQIFHIYLTDSFTLIDDWNRRDYYPDEEMTGLQFLRQLELRRIELSRRAGHAAEPLAVRPVAFAVFHALNQDGHDCYLFEVNRDWRRLNLIGGKQESVDHDDFKETVLREIKEELGIPPDKLSVAPLNDEPLIGFSLSGNAGSLATYPCVLFSVTVDGPLRTRQGDRWLTEQEIRQCRDVEDCPLMVNPVYLDYLLDGRKSRLSKTPLSTTDRVTTQGVSDLPVHREEPWLRWQRVLRQNKDLFAAILTMLAAIITLVVAIWW